ncbi:MAG TPA: alpha,alpha-trehalase TreF [Chitinophagaceae bacterium]|nr:alpha,alpha-trehalase TreF [Chitinophagaceae bacterium]
MAGIEVYDLHPLFENVQMLQVFPDGKTFVDCVPKISIEEINDKYLAEKINDGFNLKDFVLANFDLPVTPPSGYTSDTSKPVEENIEFLWNVLTRQPDKQSGSLIPLPHPYIVPGGRFGEIYYWDSYFTMLGLQASGKFDMIENMVNNFSFLIHTLGYIPNGNRTYFLGRSQPPFFSLMVKLLSELKEKNVLVSYLPQLEKEYRFWMKGADELNETNPALNHVVRMKDSEIMNRYWDENETPRPESYREDVELAHASEQDDRILYRHLRAGAESGWDYSSRWFKEGHSFSTIHTTDIIPVDLNCLLWHLEFLIAESYLIKKDETNFNRYIDLAEKRKTAIHKYCWNDSLNFFTDYDYIENKSKQSMTLAGVAPLFFEIATEEQAAHTALLIRNKFLKAGGLITTLEATGQQWDAPNGWAPLHWMTVIGLENYHQHDLAKEIAQRWIKLNTDVFKRTGKLMEKYNVENTQLEAGGGEYPGQDGFGWTNGILLALLKKYGWKPAI